MGGVGRGGLGLGAHSPLAIHHPSLTPHSPYPSPYPRAAAIAGGEVIEVPPDAHDAELRLSRKLLCIGESSVVGDEVGHHGLVEPVPRLQPQGHGREAAVGDEAPAGLPGLVRGRGWGGSRKPRTTHPTVDERIALAWSSACPTSILSAGGKVVPNKAAFIRTAGLGASLWRAVAVWCAAQVNALMSREVCREGANWWRYRFRVLKDGYISN